MLQPYGPVLPQENQEDNSTVQSGNGVISVLQCNRSVSMRDHLQQLSVQEEELLISDTMQRQAMDMQLQEAKRRTEEQGVVLDMRTQQLLNYTHEHVSQTRTEAERRMNEQMLEGLKASHTQLNNELQVQTHNIQQEIQAQLRVEREQQLAEVENRLALQTIEAQHAVNGTEDRVRSFLQTQLDGWESKLENSKSWAQVYIRTAMEAQNREFGSKIQDAVGSSIENHFQRRHDEMARLISAQVRAELRKGQCDQEKRIQACVDDASRAVEIRVDAKLAELRKEQYNQDKRIVFGAPEVYDHCEAANLSNAVCNDAPFAFLTTRSVKLN